MAENITISGQLRGYQHMIGTSHSLPGSVPGIRIDLFAYSYRVAFFFDRL